MAKDSGKLALFGSIENLIADVQNVTTSELSLRQLAVLIEEEFRAESQHMVKDDVQSSMKKKRAKKSNLKCNCWSVFMFIAFVFTFLTALVIAPEKTFDSMNSIPGFTFIMDTCFTPKEYKLSNIDWYFYALQLVRLGTTRLKIEEKYPITEHDMDSCFVNNPLYKSQKVKCSFCRKVSGFASKVSRDGFDHPMLFVNQDVKFNLARFQQVLKKNEMMINEHTISLTTNCDYVKTIESLKENHVLEKLESDKFVHITGTAVSYMSSHIMRKEFPRPQDFMTSACQTYKNYFYVDGRLSHPYKLQRSVADSNFMYIQALGSRRLIFSPPAHCSKKCEGLSRVMKEGDIVFYSNVWNVFSESVGDKSLSYVDNFENM